jgi:ferric-dicitrate binding protein FerR (iron transport regulator)
VAVAACTACAPVSFAHVSQEDWRTSRQCHPGFVRVSVQTAVPAPAPAAQSPRRRRRPTGKRLWLYRLALLLALVPVVELISWLGLRLANPLVTFATLHDEQEQLAQSAIALDDRAEAVPGVDPQSADKP